MCHLLRLLCVFMVMHVQASTASDQLSNKAKISQKIVIAHRGASGYLPEHSMAAKQLAFEMGAHYIEQDIVLSKDDKLLVLHDLYLDRVTDVAEIFPDRARADGRYYAIDFNFQEIATLRLTERFQVKNNQQVAQFPDRSPLWKGNYKIHQLKDEVELITKLNKQNNLEVGICLLYTSPSPRD